MTHNSIPLFIEIPADNDGQVDVHFNTIHLDPDKMYEISLSKLFCWNSFNNISSTLNNNILKYSSDAGTTWKTVTYEDGNYSLSEIQNALNDVLETNGDIANAIYFQPIMATSKLKVILQTDYQIDFSVGNLYQRLGFNNIIYTANTTAPNRIDMYDGIREIFVMCNLVHAAYRNNQIKNILYTFHLEASPNNLIVSQPSSPVWMPMRHQTQISHVNVQLLDNKYRPLKLTTDSEVVILIREKPIN